MRIYLNLAMSILVVIHPKAILIKIIQTTFSLFNQFCIIVSKHKPILSKSILSESILSKTEPNTHLMSSTWLCLICTRKIVLPHVHVPFSSLDQ